ncbi:MAG: RidA family protein [Anaerolineales bacterium]|nr:RidA family protein [Anaerolineales bacterium]
MTKKKIISTDKAPAAIGPYSQATVAGNLVFTAGQIPLDPTTGELVTGGIEEQTHQVLQNIRSLLQVAGSNMESVTKTTVFMTNLDDFNGMNEVYAKYLANKPPARTTVQVSGLPMGANIEIECVAVTA